jgi:D-amino peptidase
LSGTAAVLGAFLRLTAGEGDAAVALRGLALHMLEGHAPGFFASHDLAPRLEEAVEALRRVPGSLPLDLDPDLLQARVDAWYVCRERRAPGSGIHPREAQEAIDMLLWRGHALYAWLVTRLLRQGGSPGILPMEDPALDDPLLAIYFDTHRVLLATRYLRTPPEGGDLEAVVARLRRATPGVVERRQVDLGAEIAFALQAAGGTAAPEHAALVELVRSALEPDGTAVDRSTSLPADEVAAHATAAALIALAGAEDRDPGRPSSR